MVQLLDLPAEILREILVCAVSVRGLKRGFRLRLVNRFFSQEITQALFASTTLDEYIDINMNIEKFRGPEHEAFWQAYLTSRVMSPREPFLSLYKFVHKVAERLCEATGDKNTETLRNYVHQLCYWPWKMLETASRSESAPNSWDQPQFLLRAAIITGCSDVVKELLDGPDFPAAFTPTRVLGALEPWESAVYLAAERGQTQILEKEFLDQRLDTRELREVAISAAIKTGNLPLVEFIMDSRWGPPDFFSSSLCVEENLMPGILNSPLVDFSSRLFALFKSRATTRYPIEIHEPDVNRLLNDVVFCKPQRVDVAEWLLDHGATFHQKQEFRHGVGKRYVQTRWIWQAQRRAVGGGNEKIARLFLERGTDPNATDNFVLPQAVISNRLDIVRMLVEHNADVKAKVKVGPRSSWEPNIYGLMANAVMTEDKELCNYLVANGVECDDEALTRAIDQGLETMVRFLLENGAKVTSEMVDKAKQLKCSEIEQILQSALRSPMSE